MNFNKPFKNYKMKMKMKKTKMNSYKNSHVN